MNALTFLCFLYSCSGRRLRVGQQRATRTRESCTSQTAVEHVLSRQQSEVATFFKRRCALLLAFNHPRFGRQSPFSNRLCGNYASQRSASFQRQRHVWCSDPRLLPSVHLALRHAALGKVLSLEAWVHRSQIHGKKLAFLKLGDGEDGGEYLNAILQMPTKRVRLYASGSKVSIQGVLEQDDRGWLLHAHEIKLICVAASTATIRRVLSAASDGDLLPAEAKAALCLNEDAGLPTASDRKSSSAILAKLEEIVPSRMRDAASGVLPAPPSSANEPALASLLLEGGMQRACAALQVMGGGTASVALTRGRVRETELPRGLFVIDGEVYGRRQLSDGFWVIDIRRLNHTRDMSASLQDSEHCVLHTSFGDEKLLSYAALAANGAHLRVVGIRPPEGNLSDVLLVSGAQLLRSSTQLKAVRRLLKCVTDGTIDALEALRAVSVDPVSSREAAMKFQEAVRAESHAEHSWRAAALQQALAAHQAVHYKAEEQPSNKSDSKAPKANANLLQSYDYLRKRYPLRQLKLREDSQAKVGSAGDELNFLWQQPELRPKKGEAPARHVAWPRPAGVLATGRATFWQAKKRPQLLLMAQVVADLLSARTSGDNAAGKCAQVLDVGGGKGFLAQHLAERFGPRVNMTVVDIRSSLIAEGARRAQRWRGEWGNLHFVAGNASELLSTGTLGHVDIIVGLHACGGLSDVILGHAVTQGAAFAVATCCYLSHQHLHVQEGCGISIPRDDWLMPPASLHNASRAAEEAALTKEGLHVALHAAEQQKDPVIAALGVHTVSAIRAKAVEQHWAKRWYQDPSEGNVAELESQDGSPTQNLGQRFSVQLFSFDPKYSPRNTVIVGSPIF